MKFFLSWGDPPLLAGYSQSRSRPEEDDDDDDGGGGCDDDDLGGWRIGLRRQRMFSAVSGLQLLQQQGEF